MRARSWKATISVAYEISTEHKSTRAHEELIKWFWFHSSKCGELRRLL